MTPSEELLAEYFRDARRGFVRDPLVSGTKPDFLVDGTVICEVTSFTKDHLPKCVGARDPLHPLRLKVRDKWPQAEAAMTGGYPFVLVLHQSGHETDLGLETLAAAMFGDLSVPTTFNPRTGSLSFGSDFAFGEHGSTEVGNRNLSAAAILRVFNPTLVDLQAAWSRLRLGDECSTVAHLEARAAIEEELTAAGIFDPLATARRLIVVHSARPAIRVPVGWLGGAYDEEWAIDERTGELTGVHRGKLHHRVPQRSRV